MTTFKLGDLIKLKDPDMQKLLDDCDMSPTAHACTAPEDISDNDEGDDLPEERTPEDDCHAHDRKEWREGR